MTASQFLAIVAPAVLAMAASAAQVAPEDAPVRERLEQLARRRIFFGHQSVGQNLLDGIRSLATREGVEIRFRETVDPAEVRPGTIAHALIGSNGDPIGKLAAFERVMRSGMGDAVDVAFMKFCYVDFGPDTDAQALFRRYRAVMDGLQARYPRLTLLYVTVPLTTVQSGKKALLKKMLGRAPSGVMENERREEFNALLRQAYGGKVLDLARAESTWPDGRREAFSWQGRGVPVLVSAYTEDGGHLTSDASVRIARGLLYALVAPGNR